MSIRHMTTRRLLQRSKTTLNDAIQLTHQFIKDKPNTLEQSRQILRVASTADPTSTTNGSNSLAVTLLRVDRELVFVRYYGMAVYIRNYIRDQPSSSWVGLMFGGRRRANNNDGTAAHKVDTNNHRDGWTTTRDGSSNANGTASSTSSNKVARVAFMITSQQKNTLREMQYTDGDIKGLKPLEALLIIEHGISAHEIDWKPKVAELVRQEEMTDQSEDDENHVTAAEGEKINNEQIVNNAVEQQSDIIAKVDNIDVDATLGPKIDTSSSKVARVAFMITSQQKHTLREMQYTDGDIKGLKPLEALLIIEHGISAHEIDWKPKVAELVRQEMITEQSEYDKTQVTAAEEEIINNEQIVNNAVEQQSEIIAKVDNIDDDATLGPKIDANETKQQQLLLGESAKDQSRPN